ncbi:SDR family oxidoreductase [Microbacterium sp. No. 7]|uniref:SDR family oxidoreductase n=1 Tax=Microbacterium sp. No. 7 TaxID=1714373 RepID=UPI0006CF5C82|nr:SDR family oxidoreductase [Microbacterium sp. No. 7]ALJ21936.1 short-chain dehydrogenase [Microbacterium sp. No. 7]
MGVEVVAPVLVVIGVGGMGETIARRLAPGHRTVLADFNEELLERVTAGMTVDGFDVEPVRVDVSSYASVQEVAALADGLGPVTRVVHTAGLSPTQAPAEAVLRVDLGGVAYMLDAFAQVVAPGGAGVVISSSSGYLFPPFTGAQAQQIREATVDTVLDIPFLTAEAVPDAGAAYAMAKQANRIQVQHASGAWGARGARINSVSPGIISTAMGRQEMASPSGELMRAMVERSGLGRIGTPSDIADAVTFLMSPQAGYVTGIDLLVDGGSVAAVASGRIPFRPSAEGH